MKQIGTMDEVRSELIRRGWYSVAAWAKAHGHVPVTVRRVVYDWGQREDRPLGGIGRQVIQDLKKTMSTGDMK